jgi:hypothetical protein
MAQNELLCSPHNTDRRRFIKLSGAGFAWAMLSPAHANAGLTITGPIPVTAQSGESYRGSNEQPIPGPGLPPPDLDRYGYVQEEYFISGTVDGKAYSTSLLVRKPKNPAKFSGLVGVETIHAGGAIPFWGTGREVWAPGGHAWVGVASQRAALENQVKKFNPARYAELQLPEAASSADQANSTGGMTQDMISQAIMTQAGAFLKSNTSLGPFAGMPVKYLLMGGASQTGGTTLSYIQQAHARARMPDGKPIYDGYLPAANFTIEPVSLSDAAIIHLVGEGDFELFSRVTRAPGFRVRGDSDSVNDRYREYEVVAASHVPSRGSTAGMKAGEIPSQFPSIPIYKGALINLIEWVTKGILPPKASPIERMNGEIVRDKFGNAKGGVRSPYVDVPTVRYIASAPLAEGDDHSRAQHGLQEPIPAEKLRALYKTRAHYLKRFDQGIDEMVARRWIVAADGEKLKDEEASSAPL